MVMKATANTVLSNLINKFSKWKEKIRKESLQILLETTENWQTAGCWLSAVSDHRPAVDRRQVQRGSFPWLWQQPTWLCCVANTALWREHSHPETQDLKIQTSSKSSTSSWFPSCCSLTLSSAIGVGPGPARPRVAGPGKLRTSEPDGKPPARLPAQRLGPVAVAMRREGAHDRVIPPDSALRGSSG